MSSTDPSGEDTPRRVRLALLDDHEVLLDTISSWIYANAPDFDLVLSASTWLELVHSDNFPTDLVFIDFQLQETISIEARVRTCRAAGAKVIVISSLDTREARERALAAGLVALNAPGLDPPPPLGEFDAQPDAPHAGRPPRAGRAAVRARTGLR